MKFVGLIIFIIMSSVSFSQDAKNEAVKKERDLLFGVHLDYSASRLEGVDGRERAAYLSDYIEDLNFNGVPAEGGLTPRIGLQGGVFLTKYLGRRFALHSQLDYLQTGFTEKITAFGATHENEMFEQSRVFKLKLDYVNMTTGLKYFNDYGLTLYLGVMLGYNAFDRVTVEESYKYDSRAGLEAYTIDEQYFFHEYYGVNRQIFLTGGVFAIGFQYQKFELDASIRKTSSVSTDETVDMSLMLFQIGLKYRLNKLNNED